MTPGGCINIDQDDAFLNVDCLCRKAYTAGVYDYVIHGWVPSGTACTPLHTCYSQYVCNIKYVIIIILYRLNFACFLYFIIIIYINFN